MMPKDFYQVLGLAPGCSQDDIKTAYRKLAVKFHPDKNPGDAYFEERFKELQEAYSVLSDPAKRWDYDARANRSQAQQPHSANQGRGRETRTRYSDQERAKSNEDKKQGGYTPDSLASNVEEVYRKVKYSDIDNIKKDQLILFLNSVLNENIVSELLRIGDTESNRRIVDTFTGMFKFLSEDEIVRYSAYLIRLAGADNELILKVHNSGKERIRTLHNDRLFSWVKWAVGIGIVIWAIIFFNSDERQTSSSNTYNKNPSLPYTSNPKPVIDDGIGVTAPLSKYVGNQLRTGDSPYNDYFGKGVYDRNYSNRLEVKNGQELDVIVCLTEYYGEHRSIRNEYIRAGQSFVMTNIPDGIYYLKSFYGKDWNPDTVLFDGRLNGYFDTNSGFTVSDRQEDLIEMKQTYENFTVYTVTLYPVLGGNMESRNISADQFFKNN